MTQEQQIALYEEARSLANIACWSIELQIHRLRKEETEIPEFVMQRVADFHFLLIAINRLRHAADLAAETIDIAREIKKFDQSLPAWRKMRNAMEHIDEYWQHKGRDPSVSAGGLPVFLFDEDAVTWCGVELKLETVRQASSRPFQAIQGQSPHAKNNRDQNSSRVERNECG